MVSVIVACMSMREYVMVAGILWTNFSRKIPRAVGSAGFWAGFMRGVARLGVKALTFDLSPLYVAYMQCSYSERRGSCAVGS